MSYTVNIALNDYALTSGERATVTFTFSEAVMDFDLSSLSAGNATLSQPQSIDGGKDYVPKI